MTAVDHAGLLLAIREDPADDGVRLILADWLEEHGRPERAEFVRVQVELARLVAAFRVSVPPEDASPRDEWYHPAKGWCDCPYCTLRRRERELLTGHLREWFNLPRFDNPVNAWRCTNLDETRLAVDALFTFRRGFVAHVTLTLAAFEAHAAALFGAAPLESVRLGDDAHFLYKVDGENRRHFFREFRFPSPALYALIESADVPPVRPGHEPPWKRFPDAEAARTALSAAAVTLGRRLAGLPALPAKEATDAT